MGEVWTGAQLELPRRLLDDVAHLAVSTTTCSPWEHGNSREQVSHPAKHPPYTFWAIIPWLLQALAGRAPSFFYGWPMRARQAGQLSCRCRLRVSGPQLSPMLTVTL